MKTAIREMKWWQERITANLTSHRCSQQPNALPQYLCSENVLFWQPHLLYWVFILYNSKENAKLQLHCLVDIDWLEFQLKEGFLRNICQEVPGGCKRVCCAWALSGLTSLLSDLKRFRLIFNFSSMSLPFYLKASFPKNAHTVLWIQPLTAPCYTLCIKKKEQTDKKMKHIFRLHC